MKFGMDKAPILETVRNQGGEIPVEDNIFETMIAVESNV
jgi:hypothetical protein